MGNKLKTARFGYPAHILCVFVHSTFFIREINLHNFKLDVEGKEVGKVGRFGRKTIK